MPVFCGTFVLSNILGGAILFNEFKDFTYLQSIMYEARSADARCTALQLCANLWSHPQAACAYSVCVHKSGRPCACVRARVPRRAGPGFGREGRCSWSKPRVWRLRVRE